MKWKLNCSSCNVEASPLKYTHIEPRVHMRNVCMCTFWSNKFSVVIIFITNAGTFCVHSLTEYCMRSMIPTKIALFHKIRVHIHVCVWVCVLENVEGKWGKYIQCVDAFVDTGWTKVNVCLSVSIALCIIWKITNSTLVCLLWPLCKHVVVSITIASFRV